MDQRTALRVLVEKSTLLSDEMKMALLGKIDGMSDDEVGDLGMFLAQEQAQELIDAEEGIVRIDEVVEQIDRAVDQTKNPSS
jgi:hypothetical protein